MNRKWMVASFATFTVISCWIATRVGRSDRASLALAQDSGRANTAERRTVAIERAPLRILEDPYSTFNGLALDEQTGEVFLSNDNEARGVSIETYHADFAPTDRITEPIRKISGRNAHLGAICGLAISPEFKEVFKVNGDGNGDVGVFSTDANGDASPLRELTTSHGAWGIFLEAKFDELFITVEHVNRLSVYSRTAQGDQAPLRYIQGPKTALADPHGIYADVGRNEVYVANDGHWHYTAPGETFTQVGSEMKGTKARQQPTRPLAPSTGKFVLPSITVYPRTGSGDIAPLRVIEGNKTGLNVPLGLFLDTASNQLVVANAGGNSVLFFDANASGDVAPLRGLGGPRTELAGPTSVVIDNKRNELWVTNWDNHTATVYPRTAQGDVAPLRTLRSAPKGAPDTGFGRPGTVAYDPKRKEILVPN